MWFDAQISPGAVGARDGPASFSSGYTGAEEDSGAWMRRRSKVDMVEMKYGGEGGDDLKFLVIVVVDPGASGHLHDAINDAVCAPYTQLTKRLLHV